MCKSAIFVLHLNIMQTIKYILQHEPKHTILAALKDRYQNKTSLTNDDISVLNAHETYDYDLLGIIGLLINSKPRIALGKKQTFEHEIQEWCSSIDITWDDLKLIADKYLDDDFEDEPEYILRKVMLEYPNER